MYYLLLFVQVLLVILEAFVLELNILTSLQSKTLKSETLATRGTQSEILVSPFPCFLLEVFQFQKNEELFAFN